MKKGDKLVCITNDFCTYKLEIGKIYTVASVSRTNINIDYIILYEDPYRHSEFQFISLEKHIKLNRKEKLQKICSK